MGRLTPYDAKVAGTFAERPAPPKAAPRALTAAEVRADNTAAVRLAAAAGHRFDTVYADGAYATDANRIYLCREHRYRSVTGFKVDTVPASNGCLAGGAAAARWCSVPYAERVLASGYGTRRKCGCVFSDLKRFFPETLTARSRAGLIGQVLSRVRVFNGYKRIMAGIMRVTGNGIAVA